MNRFDYSIVAIFALLLFGLYGAGFQPIRIFISLLTFINIFYIYRFFCLKKNIYLLFVTLSLTFYSLISTLFIFENFVNSLIAFIYFILNIMLFINFVCCVEFAKKPILSIQLGSLIFSFISVVYGIYEISTGNHLSVSFLEGERLSLRDYSSFTFGNYNAFVLALMVNMPILAYIIINNNISKKIIAILLLLGMSYIILINGSRAGLAGLLLTVIYLFFCTKNIWMKSSLIASVLVFISLFISKFTFLATRLAEVGVSDTSRSSILFDVFPIFLKEGMTGFGIGNFAYYAQNILNLNLYAPHNFFLEILFELGLISFIIVIIFFMKIIFSVFSNAKRERFFVFYLLLLFIPFCVLNSGYLLTAIVWLFIALIYSFSFSKVS